VSWNGEERRKKQEYCDGHIKLCEDVSFIKAKLVSLDERINGSLEAISKHISEGKGWRTTIASITVAMIVQIIIFANIFGALCKQVEINTVRLDAVEVIHPRTIK